VCGDRSVLLCVVCFISGLVIGCVVSVNSTNINSCDPLCVVILVFCCVIYNKITSGI